MDFDGTKVALFFGDDLVVLRRDAHDHIPWPDYLDLPGGGRENAETPQECTLRETREEIGVSLEVEDLHWGRVFKRHGGVFWFFAAHLPMERASDIRLGDEGQGWQLMAADVFCGRDDAVPYFKDQLRIYLGKEAPEEERIACFTPAKGRDGSTRIPAWKYRLIQTRITEAVSEAGVDGCLFSDLRKIVKDRIRDEEKRAIGSIDWHVTTIKLNMEVDGELARLHAKGPQRIINVGKKSAG